MNKINILLNHIEQSGVYQAGPDTRCIMEAARETGMAAWRVDIGRVHGKADFIGLLAAALEFPEGFGANWDALADCLADLSWHPATGYVLILEHGKHFGSGHHEEFVVAVEVLKSVADNWRDRGKAFWAIVSGPEGWDSGLPALPA
ncbi:MAG: barstar family protein [Burkholderiales bacterium]|nr:barstar family protein [Burkholderiales bacterium]